MCFPSLVFYIEYVDNENVKTIFLALTHSLLRMCYNYTLYPSKQNDVINNDVAATSRFGNDDIAKWRCYDVIL